MKCNYNGCSSKCKGDVDTNSCNILKAYQQGRVDERRKIIEILDSVDDIPLALVFLAQYIISEDMKAEEEYIHKEQSKDNYNFEVGM